MCILNNLPQHPTQETFYLDSLVFPPQPLRRNPTQPSLRLPHWEAFANPPPSFLIHKTQPCPLLSELSAFCIQHITAQVVSGGLSTELDREPQEGKNWFISL